MTHVPPAAAHSLPDRKAQMRAFTDAAGWQGATLQPLAGDASFRRYERVVRGEERAVLMDAPPEKEDVRPFVKVAEYLSGQGLSAPEILAKDVANGFLLLEDLGDDSYTRVLQQADTTTEMVLYKEAVAALATLHQQNRRAPIALDVPEYSRTELMREIALFTDWYLPAVMGDTAEISAHANSFLALWEGILDAHPLVNDVVVLRDYHADNLLWLPQREGIRRVGQLDFQDALIGHAAYDLVSLLEDARRDVAAQTVETALEHYIALSGCDRDALMTGYALLGAQRNIKIIGIFCRLGMRDGKTHYTGYLPRVWGHLQHDVQHPALAALRDWLDTHIPAAWRGAITLPSQRQE